MRKFIVNYTNDRGNQDRLSTRHDNMEIEVFYMDKSGSILKANLNFTVNNMGRLVVNSDNYSLGGIAIVGTPASKLSFK